MDKTILKGMNDTLRIQGNDGNWNYSPSMLGMYNGMELMVAMAEGREPNYREKPDQWLEDMAGDNEVKAVEE